MPKRSKRTVPGLVTIVGDYLRILNGDVESLQRYRRPGRPRKFESGNDKRGSGMNFPSKEELRDSGMRDGFRLVRHRSHKEEITRKNQDLQEKFNALCSEVKVITDPSKVEASFTSGKISRIEMAVPFSFCSCTTSTDEMMQMPCLIHGLKRLDCDCGGINGITGYRGCMGHRRTGQMSGVKVGFNG